MKDPSSTAFEQPSIRTNLEEWKRMNPLSLCLIVGLATYASARDIASPVANNPIDRLELTDDAVKDFIDSIAKLSRNPEKDASYECSRTCMSGFIEKTISMGRTITTDQALDVGRVFGLIYPLHEEFKQCVYGCNRGDLQAILLELTKVVDFVLRYPDDVLAAINCTNDSNDKLQACKAKCAVALGPETVTPAFPEVTTYPTFVEFPQFEFSKESAIQGMRLMCKIAKCGNRCVFPELTKTCGKRTAKFLYELERKVMGFVIRVAQQSFNLEDQEIPDEC